MIYFILGNDLIPVEKSKNLLNILLRLNIHTILGKTIRISTLNIIYFLTGNYLILEAIGIIYDLWNIKNKLNQNIRKPNSKQTYFMAWNAVSRMNKFRLDKFEKL